MNIQTRVLKLLGRAADQRSSHIALHLKLDEWAVVGALQQLERAGKVKRCTVKRRNQDVTVYRLSAGRAKVSSNPHKHHDDCLSTSTLNPLSLTATVVASSGGP